MAEFAPETVDPKGLLRPTSVAKLLDVHPSMVTHWLQDNTLDYVVIDGSKLVFASSVEILKAARTERAT